MTYRSNRCHLIRRLAILISMLWPMMLVGVAAAGEETVLTYAPAPADNPLKGLVPYADPVPDRFPHSMEFQYIDLSKLVVGPDKYDFAELETLLSRVAARGNQTIFRVVVEYPGRKNLIPKFLMDDGLKIHRYLNTNTAPLPPQQVETPDYSDPRLVKTLVDFIRELGRIYDGDPRIGYITAGLLGTWGEWHTYPRSDLWASNDVQREILNAYANAFRKTPILLRYPAGKSNREYADTSRLPFGYHDDSFAFATLRTARPEDDWFFESLMRSAKLADVWKRHPIGGEIRPEVWGCCFDESPCTAADQSFDKCRTATHVTWLMDTGMFKARAESKRYERAIEQVQKMGYEFHIERSRIELLGKASECLVSIDIKNTGIAPFYHPDWKLELGLIGDDGRLQQRWPTDWSLNPLMPEEPATRWTTKLPSMRTRPKGHFAIRVIPPMKEGKPLRFANQEQDLHAKGWLTLDGSKPR